jgi:hypothetical protein
LIEWCVVGRSKLKAFFGSIALAAAACGVCGCSSVALIRNPGSRVYTDPSYEVTEPFFFLGLVGHPAETRVDEICFGHGANQILTRYTAGDVVATLFTLGIYAPRTLRIWCSL